MVLFGSKRGDSTYFKNASTKQFASGLPDNRTLNRLKGPKSETSR